MHPRDEDFVVTLSTREGVKVWVATCEVCGGGFLHMTYDRQIIQALEDHVHLEEPRLNIVLALSGHPGSGNDHVLRAIGVPQEML